MTDSTFEPEIDADLFDQDDLKSLDDYDDHAFDEDDLDEWSEEDEDEEE